MNTPCRNYNNRSIDRQLQSRSICPSHSSHDTCCSTFFVLNVIDVTLLYELCIAGLNSVPQICLVHSLFDTVAVTDTDFSHFFPVARLCLWVSISGRLNHVVWCRSHMHTQTLTAFDEELVASTLFQFTTISSAHNLQSRGHSIKGSLKGW